MRRLRLVLVVSVQARTSIFHEGVLGPAFLLDLTDVSYLFIDSLHFPFLEHLAILGCVVVGLHLLIVLHAPGDKHLLQVGDARVNHHLLVPRRRLDAVVLALVQL